MPAPDHAPAFDTPHAPDPSPAPRNDSSAPPRRVLRCLRSWTRILVGIVAACAAAGCGSRWHPYLDLLSALQLQYLCAFLALGLLLTALRSWRWLAVTSIGLVITGAQVLPWYLDRANLEASAQPDLQILLANVCQHNTRHAAVRSHAERVDADVLVFQEVDATWHAALQPLAVRWPHTVFVPGTYLRGLAVFSRFPLRDVQVEAFGNPLAPSVACTLEVGGTPLTLLVTHPWSAIDRHGFASRNRQLALVADFVVTRRGPLVLVGDLNATMWSDADRRFIAQTGLRNARRGFGVLPSFPLDRLALLRLPIDHCLIRPGVAVTDCRLGDPAGSDHAPLIVGLKLSGSSE